MNNIDQMTIEQILNLFWKKGIDLTFKSDDVKYFCDDLKLIDEIKKEDSDNKIKNLLISNDSKVDKGKFLFIVWLNYKEQIENIFKKGGIKDSIDYRNIEREIVNINKEIEKAKRDPIGTMEKSLKVKGKDRLHDLNSYSYAVNLFESVRDRLKSMKHIQDILKNNDINLIFLSYTPENKVKMDIFNTKELFSKKELIRLNNNEENNKKIFKTLDKSLADGNLQNSGMSYVLQAIDLDDLKYVMPAEIAKYASFKINENVELKEDMEFKDNREYENYALQSIIPEIKQTTEELLRYIDMPKLLLLSIKKIEMVMENKGEELDLNNLKAAKLIAETLLDFIPKNTIVETDPEYKRDDVVDLLKRINEDKVIYIPKNETEKLKNDLLNGYNLANLPDVKLSVLRAINFSEKELRKIMNISPENFGFATVLLKLPENEIVKHLKEHPENYSEDLAEYLLKNEIISTDALLELYYSEIVDADFFEKNSELTDISSKINLDSIEKDYKENKWKFSKDEKEKSKFEKSLDLYRILHIEGKTKEEKEDISNNVMLKFAEDFNDENEMELFYEKGLLTLGTLADWNGGEYIEKLYKKGKITIQDAEKLFEDGKIDQETIHKIAIQKQPETYEELMEYILKGFYTEDRIIDLYMQGKIFDVDLEEIAKQGYISPVSYLDATKNRTMEILEENSNIKLKLTNVPYKSEINGIEIEEDPGIDGEDVTTSPDGYNFTPEDKKKKIIDPFVRYKYFEALKAVPAEAIGLDEDNDFYHYEFFVIPDKDGKLQPNSIVIAERILKDVDHPEEGLATNNATYFFQYKDLMVSSNLTKKEMMEERKKIVEKTNHRLGSWAIRVLYKIAMIQKSSDLSEFKIGDERAREVLEELHKLYSDEEIMEIIDLAGEIDDYTIHDIEIEEER